MSLNKCIIILFIFFGIPASYADDQTSAGGQGKIQGEFYQQCFDVKSSVVTNVCTDYTIRWKMWSLMGEPVEEFVTSWKLRSITLMDFERKKATQYSAIDIPDQLKKGADSIELYIDGLANVITSDCTQGYHSDCHRIGDYHFNTGAAVRAGDGSSMNTPGGPKWDKFFVKSGNSCGDKNIDYLEPDTAKHYFKQGVKIDLIKLCPASGVSELVFLESAISKLCEQSGADKKYQFCPVQKVDKKKDNAQAIDDAFKSLDKNDNTSEPKKINKSSDAIRDGFASLDAQAPVQKEQIGDIDSEFHKVEAYRVRQQEYTNSCQKLLREQSRCVSSVCGAEPDKSIKEMGWNGCLNCSGDNNTQIYEHRNPKHDEWESCANNHVEQCTQKGKRVVSVSECAEDMESKYQKTQRR